MGSKEFKFDKNVICDICGEEGTFDIYGDFICNECMIKIEKKKMILTLNNGQVKEVIKVETFMCGLGLKVVYPDGERDLFCYLEWVSVMK